MFITAVCVVFLLEQHSSYTRLCYLESYVDDSKLYLSFPVAEASNMIQQINKDLKKSQAGAVITAFS